ncbi:hypothetical protein [Halovivax limisalsi]|uniref:hypothetical protein n=1 Tax=Halovivax limisalsi TaxID=1453760 RepID=UPI001FFD5B07|nr:hypothetical protein [Halovivax limisalsi]
MSDRLMQGGEGVDRRTALRVLTGTGLGLSIGGRAVADRSNDDGEATLDEEPSRSSTV